LILAGHYGYEAIFSLEVNSSIGSGVIYGLLRKENPNSEDEKPSLISERSCNHVTSLGSENK